MRAHILKVTQHTVRAALAAFLLTSGAAMAADVNLTAASTSTTLPDGQTVPMWGYSCTGTTAAPATCAAANPNAGTGWSPVVITVPAGNLTIHLTNSLPVPPGAAAGIPTSLVIVGQLGGGLGGSPTRTASPEHAVQGTTWPGAGGTGPNDAVFTPPPQAARVQSFATEIANGATTALTWNNLRPGTYLIESGTHPSIQGAMGMFGMLVVTAAPSGSTPGTAYPGVTYNAEVPLLLSEIDPVQNAAVDAAVKTSGFSETAVWSGQTGGCGNPSSATYHTCYPPAVNYSPRYYLINGTSFDRTNSARSLFAAAPATATGTLLVRFVNAGLRMHVPSIVGAQTGTSAGFALIAQDGNLLPGNRRVQDEVFLAAGKTYDVMINAPVSGAGALAVFDRSLGLSTNNQRDGGMQGYIGLNGAVLPADTPLTLSATSKTFYCVAGTTLSVSDPSTGVLAGSTGANGATLTAVSLGGVPTVAPFTNFDFNSNGTFTYTQLPTNTTCGGTFSILVNGTAAATVAITQCDASTPACTALGGAPLANADTYTSAIATQLKIAPPGILENDTDPAGHPLTVDTASIVNTNSALTLGVNPDGSFNAVVTAPGTYTFKYKAKNSQGMVSASPATVTLNFPSPSNLAVTLVDARNGQPITDYRWVIEEDRTFYSDPKCQVNTTGTRLDSKGNACPPLPVQSLGYNFHTANMPVVATGCVGDVSCESLQTMVDPATGNHVPAACDIGNGVCHADATEKVAVAPSQVYLDPNKRYYISVMPGDGENPTVSGTGGPVDTGKTDSNGNPIMRPFNLADCTSFAPGTGDCGHEMGGAQIAAGQTAVNIRLQEIPLPTSKITVFVYEDDNPLNGENDAGGGVDILAPNEPGLGGFNITLFDQAGGLGDNTGQITYDEFNMPVSNSLAGYIDPLTGQDACPITKNPDGLVGVIPTCPTYEADGTTLSPLAGQAVIANLYAGLYEVVATPAADRIGRGEEWLQTNTLDGGKPHEAFIKPDEPAYFQEFGPGGFHVMIGFANPQIINDRKHNAQGTGICDPQGNPPRDPVTGLLTKGGGLTCTATLTGKVTNARMSRTPDQRVYSSGGYDAYSFTQCYVGLGAPDEADFAFAKCDADGNFVFKNIPLGNFKISVFDQWNDIMLDGLVSQVTVDGQNVYKEFPVTQWRTNLYTRTYLDTNGDGVSQDSESGLPLVSTNIRYRDGSIGFFNNTDLNGYAGFNEVFPFMNWLVVETDSTRYKQTATHVVYDAGGPADGAGGGSSTIAAGLANTVEAVPLPNDLRVPGARYCASADCPAGDTAGGSTGRVDPLGVTTEGWQGLLGQSTFMEFGMKPFQAGENGGIKGHVIYASTRPFDDPSLSLQLQWEPGVPRVKINLYQEGAAPDGTQSLKLVDTTTTSSWDDWAQGFRSDGKPNMNCPGQDPTSPFFATLKDSPQFLNPTTALPYDAQFKCYDGWSQLNQAQPAPYDGLYKFPSVTSINPANGLPAATNCTICVDNPSGDGTKMLPDGKYVVEVIVPPGFELVKEEDKNILLGDVYIAPVTQQFAGFGNIFILPDQAAMNAYYNANNAQNSTTNLGSVTFPRHEGDTGSVESYWPCVGALRIVPDYNSLFPGAQQSAPFAGASRHLCDRKEVTLNDQTTALAKFYVFTPTHIAGHFTGTMTNDFASEFDPFSPQFGEKFGPPNLPVAMRDFAGNEVSRVYSDQWGIYNGLYFSTWSVNPPNPTGYVPQMSISCMNDPGPIPGPNGTMITDPNYNPAYSNFCYEMSFMPGFTAYMDTPVVPVMAFAEGYNLPDSEYPDATPAIMQVNGDGVGPWVGAANNTYAVTSLSLNNGGSGFTGVPTVTFSGNNTSTSASATAAMRVTGVSISNAGSYSSVPTVAFTGGGGSGAMGTAYLGVGSVNITNSGQGSYTSSTPTVTATFAAPPCTINTTTCIQATGTVNMTTSGFGGSTNSRRRVGSITITNPGRGYTSAPVVTFSRGTAQATATVGVSAVTVDASGSGYTSLPAVSFSGGSGSGAAASARLSIDTLTLTSGGGYTSTGVPTVGFSGASGSGASASATMSSAPVSHTLTITALGDKVIQNPAYSGPAATTAPFNLKTITRHYGFGGSQGSGSVTIGGRNATVTSWSDTSITVQVPTGVPACAVQQRGQPAALCGELAITAGNGKQSIDTAMVTIGGKAPTHVDSENVDSNALQIAIDNAAPGDLIMVGPGVYKEMLLMWKPIRLQGAGAAAVTLNADAHPAGKLDPWRRQVNCLFGLTLDGAPNPDNAGYDPSGTFTCPDSMFMRSDRIPFEGFVGWDAASNGNLAQVLQEPSLMGAYEGAGVTVLGRGINVHGSSDFWGQVAPGAAETAGAFPDGSTYLTSSNSDCASTTAKTGYDYGTGNFLCNPSRIDGLSIINSSQGGGAIFMHGWNHNMEISNNRINANSGTLSGGINVGNGETPPQYINDGTICGPGVVAPAPLCPPLQNTPSGAQIPFALNVNVHVHNNSITDNASLGDALFSGTPTGAGGITFSAGDDNYKFDHNWVSGNLSNGDGGGVEHAGFSVNGNISNNWVLFNQSTNPTLPTNGGGIGIIGANNDRTLPNGVECGTYSDVDCPPGLGDGTGPGLVIDSNLIIGNSAESGSGGGLRLQQVNGSEVAAFPTNSSRWYAVSVTNNIIANNVAGWDGGGVSMEDSLKVSFVNNTVASNDTTGSAGVLFKSLGAPYAASTPPGCNPQPDPTLPQDPSCTGNNAPSVPQPAGFVTMTHTPNLRDALPSTTPRGTQVSCPSGYGYGSGNSLNDGSCKSISLPLMKNNLFWQNRAFHIEITGFGTGLQSQQHLVTLVPTLNQTSTGNCQGGANYWDIGVRGDTGPTNHSGGGTLSPSNSILTSLSGGYSGNGNLAPTSSPVIAQYCNGSRVPPENGGKGYNAPAGRSESTGLSTVFELFNITPAATVDEGNNWINLSYGPLSLYSNPAQAMVADNGSTLAAYSITSGSAAINNGSNSGAPDHDFFGTTRPRTGSNPADIGAVEYSGATGGGGGGGGGGSGSAGLTPATWSPTTPRCSGFGCLFEPTQAFTLTNTGSTTLTGIAQATLSGTNASSYTIVSLLSTCGPAGGGQILSNTSLAPGASCTVTVRFQPSTTQSTGLKTATVSVTDAAGTQSSALTGTAQ